MKDLEQLLRDPHAHADAPSEESWRAWSDEALAKWNAEQAQSRQRSPLRLVSNALFYAAVLMALWMLFPALASTAEKMGETVGSYELWVGMPSPWVFAGIALAIAVAITPPLRQRLLHEIG